MFDGGLLFEGESAFGGVVRDGGESQPPDLDLISEYLSGH